MALIIIDTIATLAFGVMYARRVRYRPIKPTYVEVIIGVGFSLGSSSLLALGAHLERIAFTLLNVNIIIWLPMVLTGIPMAFHQMHKEQERKEQRAEFVRLSAGENDDKGKVAIPGGRRSRPHPNDITRRAG